jgi:hypothetical protein
VIFEGLNGPFCCICSMIVQLHKLAPSFLCFEEFRDGLCGLIVGYVEGGFVPWVFQFVEHLLKCVNHWCICDILDWDEEYEIGVIIICHKVILASVDTLKCKCSCCICVQHTCHLVWQCYITRQVACVGVMLLSIIMFGPGSCCVHSAELWGCWDRSSVGTSSGTCFWVLLMPALGCFMWPLDVAGYGARYFSTMVGFMNENPLIWLLSMALISVSIGESNNVWCMYFSWFLQYGNIYTLCAPCLITCRLNMVRSRCVCVCSILLEDP